MTAPTDPILELIDAALEPDGVPRYDPDNEEGADELAAWRIDGERTALWAANKLRRAWTRRAEAVATAQALRDAADAHVALIKRQTDHDVRYFEGKLREYHESQIAGTRRKTVDLPTGIRLATRAGGVSTVVDPDAATAVLEWCEENYPEAIDYVDPKVRAAALKDRLAGKVDAAPGTYPAVDAETGELVEGVTFERGTESFTVTFTDPEPDAE